MIRGDTGFLQLCEKLADLQSVATIFARSFSCPTIAQNSRVTSLGYKSDFLKSKNIRNSFKLN
jgi:hypothetical protein